MEEDSESFAAMLRRLRKARRLTQQDLASQAGVHIRTIGDLERGKNATPQPSTLEGIEHALKLSAEECAAMELIARRRRQNSSDRSQPTAAPSAHALSGLAADAILVQLSPQTVLPDVLPHDYLLGRRALQEQSRDLLTKGACVALFGPPGVGKSALALATAHDAALRRSFSHVLYVAPGPDPDIVTLLGSWGAQLRTPSAEAINAFDADRWTLALRQTIGKRRMLLIVDDVWRSEHFYSFKVGGPNCAYLVTTRFPGLASAIADSDAIEVPELSPKDGVKLLKRLAPRAVEYDQLAVQRLISAVGCLPIALHLLGNYLRIEALSGQPRRIHAALRTLASAEARLTLSQPAGALKGRPTVSPSAPISLQALFNVSVERLSAEPVGGQQAAQALRRLAAFPPKPSSFSEEAAVAVCEVPRHALDLLYDYGLLESHGNGRYTIHQVMRDYARIHVADDELVSAQQRMMSFVAALTERHATNSALLDVESGFIHAVLRAAAQRPLDRDFMRAVIAFAPFMEQRGDYKELGHLLKLAEGAATALDDAAAIAETRLYTGRLAETQGVYPEALTWYESALAALTASSSTERLHITLLARCAELALRRGDTAEAERLARDGLERAQAATIRANVAFLWRVIAQATGDRGDMTVGDMRYREALTLAQEVGDVDTAISCLQNMGVVAFKQGRPGKAVLLLRQGLREANAIRHVRRMTALRNALGCVYVKAASMREGRKRDVFRDRAKLFLSTCFQLAEDYQLPLWQNHALQNLGELERGRQRYAQAVKHFQRAEAIAETIGERWLIAETVCGLGNLYLEMRQNDEALAAFERAKTVASDGGDEESELLAWAEYGLGRLWAAKGDIVTARVYGMKSLDRFSLMKYEQAGEVRQWLESL